MDSWLEKINSIVWGPPLLILLFGVGVYLTIRIRGLQFSHLGYALKLCFTRQDDGAKGDISQFQALMMTLAGTIGIGSITGIATAVAVGGLGALFWMWVAAAFGMATKYAEAILAVKYRVQDKNGEMTGGPMYYLERGFRQKWLAIIFAIAGCAASFSTGNMVQSNSVALAVQDLFNIAPWITGVLLLVSIGVALLGGIKSISRVNKYLVPAMAAFYIVGGLIIIFMRITDIPAAFAAIVRAAFTGEAATGGFVGASVMMAVQLGVSRGIFSHEAGLGTSSIAAAAAKTDTPGRQALISMCSVFITTGIVCTITGLVLSVTGVLGKTDATGAVLNGSAMALAAFDTVLPRGGLIVTIALIPFAYSTILGWAYYGERCMEYLFGVLGVNIYRIIYTMLVFPGAILSLNTVWGIANLANAFMAIPNLIGLAFLGSVIAKETDHFRTILKKEKAFR